MTDDSVFTADDVCQLREKLREASDLEDCPLFAEHFIEGRELNLAVLGTPEGPVVLPPAEIDFATFPPGVPETWIKTGHARPVKPEKDKEKVK